MDQGLVMGIKQAFAYAWHGSGRHWDAAPMQIFGGSVGGFLIWWQEIKVPATVLDNPALSGVAAIAIGAIFGALVVFVVRLCWYALVHHLRIRLNPFIVTAVVGIIIMTGGVAGYLWDRARGPIIWAWDGNWIAYSYSSDSPILRIHGFQIIGWNRSDDPIAVTEAFVRSDITGDHVDMLPRIQRSSPPMGYSDPVKVIPAGRKFIISGQFQPSPNAQSLEKTSESFQREFGRITFIFNGKIVRRLYDEDIEKYISRADGERRKSAEN
jgi:hypothetical protein